MKNHTRLNTSIWLVITASILLLSTKKRGHYFCEPYNGKTTGTTTILDYGKTFKQIFNFTPPPVISIAIEVDVSGTKKQNNRYSKAYIKDISIGN